MKEVSKEEFYEFLEGKDYTIRQGRFTHEDTFIENTTLGILAIRKTNSYSSKVIYTVNSKN